MQHISQNISIANISTQNCSRGSSHKTPANILQSCSENSSENSFENATGKIDYGLTNDYMFRIILQRNPNILEALICSLLHLKHEEVRSVTIQNPITPGIQFSLKDFILDIKILFNDNTIINLEMQVRKQLYWPERSLSYLCRSFDNLNKGDDYEQIKPAIHIGFLDFDLFPEYPEFYSTYQLLNVKNHHLYSDKFTLSVVNLTQIENATDEDKAFAIDYWAKIFKATTWEEIKMLAEKDKVFQETAQALYKMNVNDIERELCEAIEDFELRMAKRQMRLELLEAENEQQKAELARSQVALAEKDSALIEKDSALAEKDSALLEKDSALAEKDSIIAALQAELAKLQK